MGDLADEAGHGPQGRKLQRALGIYLAFAEQHGNVRKECFSLGHGLEVGYFDLFLKIPGWCCRPEF